MAAPLAVVSDLEDRLGRLFSATEAVRAERLLADASATVRTYTGQHFTEATTTDRLAVRRSKVRLPQAPVSAVTAVATVTGSALVFTWGGGVSIDIMPYVPVNWTWNPAGVTHVDVTYTHGYATVPDDIVAVVCQIAGRAYGTSAEQGGVASETIGSYSYTVGTVAAAGAVGLLPPERAILDRYRLPVSPALML